VQTILLFVQVTTAIGIQPKLTLPSAAQPTVYSVEPAKLKPGETVEAKLYGSNLGGVTAVQLSGSGIKVELLESTPSELRVRLTADPGLDPGSRLITIRAGASKTTASIDVGPGSRTLERAPVAPSPVSRAGNRVETRDAVDSTPDQSLRSPDVKSPTSPAAEPVVDSSASQSGSRAGKSAAHAGLRQRGDLRLTVGGCTGFRLTSGAEQSCGGSADLEVSSRGGTALTIEAEGVRSLGGMPLDQAEDAASYQLSSSAALVAGNTYLVRSRHGMAIVRVVQIRGIESVRNAPPAALRGPRLGGSDRQVQGNLGPSDLTLVLEWKVLE